jgi:hypothetical protein
MELMSPAAISLVTLVLMTPACGHPAIRFRHQNTLEYEGSIGDPVSFAYAIRHDGTLWRFRSDRVRR